MQEAGPPEAAATGQPERPALELPVAEGEYLRGAYAAARVILEYGIGGSTLLAAEMAGKTIFGVDSDPARIARLEAWFTANPPASPVELQLAGIGPVKDWGVPQGERHWRRFHRYPLGIWEDPSFVQPDVVLVAGRFRIGCLLATAYLTRRPVTVLFDDYADRPRYGEVETLVAPDEIVGRLAVFRLKPRQFPVRALATIMDFMTRPL